MENYQMWIDGKWVDAESGKTYAVLNPATEEEIARVPLGGKADIDKAVAAARKAFPAWSQKSPAERSAILTRLAGAIRASGDELAKLESLDHGFPISVSRKIIFGTSGEVEYAAQASRTLMGDVVPVQSDAVAYLKREPLGVCALITPWNFPLNMAALKIGCALATGNTCIVKPSTCDPLTTLKLAEIIAKLDLPPGTVNVVTGPGGDIGELLSSHQDVNMVSFTGSCEVGKKIMAASSDTIKRLQLELGGKNPFIVMEDADIDAAAGKAAHAMTFNSGQVCATPGRYYIHEKVHDEFVSKVVAGLKAVVIGDPLDAKTEMGPIASREHRDSIESYIKIGTEEGAKLVLGGERPTAPPFDKGYWVMPAVFTDVSQNMRIAREEIFGPVVCVLKFSSEDEVIEYANDSTFGLCASVWTRDTNRGVRMINRINAGSVWVNGHNDLRELPWGGYKESGLGKERSLLGMEGFMQYKAMGIHLV